MFFTVFDVCGFVFHLSEETFVDLMNQISSFGDTHGLLSGI